MVGKAKPPFLTYKLNISTIINHQTQPIIISHHYLSSLSLINCHQSHTKPVSSSLPEKWISELKNRSFDLKFMKFYLIVHSTIKTNSQLIASNINTIWLKLVCLLSLYVCLVVRCFYQPNIIIECGHLKIKRSRVILTHLYQGVHWYRKLQNTARQETPENNPSIVADHNNEIYRVERSEEGFFKNFIIPVHPTQLTRKIRMEINRYVRLCFTHSPGRLAN